MKNFGVVISRLLLVVSILVILSAVIWVGNEVYLKSLLQQEPRGGIVTAQIIRTFHHAYKADFDKVDLTMEGIGYSGQKLAQVLVDARKAGKITDWYVDVCVRTNYVPERLLRQYEPTFTWSRTAGPP